MSANPRFRHAAILSTGTEILQGLYPDTNAQWLATRLCERGLGVVAQVAVADDPEAIEDAVRHLAHRADLVIASGGLGPTEDDLNRFVYARLAGVQLLRDETAVQMMQERFTARGRLMPESNTVQAMIPAGAKVLHNLWGTAPGFIIENELLGTALVALPGVPGEMKAMFDKYVIPLLDVRGTGASFARIRTIHTFGRPESDLNECARDMFRANPNVQLTVLARPHGVEFRICAKAGTQQALQSLIDEFEAGLRHRIGEEDVYGVDDETLPGVVAGLLLSRRLTITTAESCTGGWIAKMLTDIPGSSDFFQQGVVTYANEAKARLLDVPGEVLRVHGAVSEATARAMAEGALARSGADLAVSVTGIAGPAGGTVEKPVGLTYIGLARKDGTSAECHRFLGDRERNRMFAALTALNVVRKDLLRKI